MFTDEEALPRLSPSPIVLRPYQDRALSTLLACRDRGLQRVIVVMPTGTGKTTLFSALIGEFDRTYDADSLVLAHRRELLDQAHRRIGLQNKGIGVALEGAGRSLKESSRVVVASVQALGRPDSKRLDGFEPGLVIVDEAHHAAAATYQRVMQRFGCYEGKCFTVGVTATPHRMDNQQLHGSNEAIFQEVAFSYTLREAIQDGWLADVRGFRVATGIDLSRVKVVRGDYSAHQLQEAVNTEERNEAAYMHWSEVAHDRRTIVFCTGIQHAADVAELFRARGATAESVNGAMPTVQREAIIRRFVNGRTQVLTNVDIATEGFDLPEVDCVLMLRPTQSWALYTQMVGRGLRVLPNTIDGLVTADARKQAVRDSEKPDCIVIDIVDNGEKVVVPKEPGENGNEKPSLAAVVGLPTDFDLEGKTLDEALKKWDSLSPASRAVMFRRPTKFEDLNATLTAVDILAELSMPESIAQTSRNAWMKIGDGVYLLPCGSSGAEMNRTARLECDTLGRFQLILASETGTAETYGLGFEMQRAFEMADRKVKDRWPFSGGFTSNKGLWRNEPVTEHQKAELRELGVDRAMIELVETAGQAWNLIELRRRQS